MSGLKTETAEVEYKHDTDEVWSNHFLKLITEAQTLLQNPSKIISPHNLGKVSGFFINYTVKFNYFFRYSSTQITFNHYGNQDNEN